MAIFSNKSIPLCVAGIVFALIAIGHLLRMVYRAQITIAGYAVPMNISYIGLVVAIILAIWMFMASHK